MVWFWFHLVAEFAWDIQENMRRRKRGGGGRRRVHLHELLHGKKWTKRMQCEVKYFVSECVHKFMHTHKLRQRFWILLLVCGLIILIVCALVLVSPRCWILMATGRKLSRRVPESRRELSVQPSQQQLILRTCISRQNNILPAIGYAWPSAATVLHLAEVPNGKEITIQSRRTSPCVWL